MKVGFLPGGSVGQYAIALLINAASDVSQQEAQIQRALFYTLVPVVVAFSFIIFLFYRARRESAFKQKEAELKFIATESELKTLRAQINPHFIFNCLNSIHHFMQGNDAPHAGEYLIKFSQLIRHVLETSSQQLVTLTDELIALKIYMELEQLRTNHSFSFHIEIHPEVHPDDVQIPPMIMQPFIENSIWHGLNRQAAGEIQIAITRNGENELLCEIQDNGTTPYTKRDDDLSNLVKKTSLGLSLINDRLNIINRLHKGRAGFELKDLVIDGVKTGSKVRLLLPYFN